MLENNAILSSMKNQPLIVSKSKRGKYVETRTFQTTSEAVHWLRNEGCTLGNGLLSISNLETTIVRLYTSEYEYEVDVLPCLKTERIKKHGKV